MLQDHRQDHNEQKYNEYEIYRNVLTSNKFISNAIWYINFKQTVSFCFHASASSLIQRL